MPHVRALIKDDDPEVVAWYKANKSAIRHAVAKVTGYDSDAIAVIGELLDPELCDNLMDFELVPLLGKNRFLEAKEVAQEVIDQVVKDSDPLPEKMIWGVWTTPNRDTGFVEYRA